MLTIYDTAKLNKIKKHYYAFLNISVVEVEPNSVEDLPDEFDDHPIELLNEASLACVGTLEFMLNGIHVPLITKNSLESIRNTPFSKKLPKDISPSIIKNIRDSFILLDLSNTDLAKLEPNEINDALEFYNQYHPDETQTFANDQEEALCKKRMNIVTSILLHSTDENNITLGQTYMFNKDVT